jgi:predicted TIM-barrel fold metal-dependent hydrolase
MIYGRLFERFPSLRVATVELGSGWVPELLRNLERAGRGDLVEDPADTFRRHVWVNAYEHEDLDALAQMIGVERILFGSDYPHTDGLPRPADYSNALKSFDEGQVRRIMRENAVDFVRPGDSS